MNYVEPIRDLERLKDICTYLKKTNERNYILFITGIYTGLRISDILRLRIRDIRNKDVITIREKKTRKMKTVQLNTVLKKEYKVYCDGREPEEYLVKSREGYNAALTRDMAYKILREVGEMFNLTNLGTHTMRKTFGYHYYKKTGDVVSLQKLFNHSHISVTLRYIGIEQEEINKTMKNFRYF